MLPPMYGIADRRRRGHGLGTKRQDFVDSVWGKISLVAPWTVEEFRQWLGFELGLTLELRPYPCQEASPRQAAECGLLVVKGGNATIWYDSARSERHQRQQIFHEFAHLLCGHHQQLPLLAAMRSGDHPLVEGCRRSCSILPSQGWRRTTGHHQLGSKAKQNCLEPSSQFNRCL